MKTSIQKIIDSVSLEEIKYDDLSFMVISVFHSFMEKNGITQKELASRLRVSTAHVSKLLSGDSNLTLKSIAKITVALDMDVEFAIVDENTNAACSHEDIWHQSSLQVWNGDEYDAIAA